MKSFKIYRAVTILILFSCLFISAKSDSPDGESDPPEKKITCLSGLDTQPGTVIRSVDGGKVLSSYSELPLELANSVVVETTAEYYYKGRVKKSTYQVIYTGVRRDGGSIRIDKGDEVGVATGDFVSLCVRTKELDPYPVGSTHVIPIRKNGYWYYFPGMYISSHMKWLLFKPAEYKEFKSMFDHATSGDEAHSFTSFNWWSLLETTLSEYPSPGKDGTSTLLIEYKGIPLRLTFQKGFLTYLHNEYILDTPIYLYLQIGGIDGINREYDCYVRDFSLVPPEKIIEERFETINNGQ